jgi:Protein kinase domain
MSARVVSDVDPDGRLVARKRSRDDADAARLAHEADVLATARHPGVVELVSCEHDDAGVALVTEFAGPHSLDTLGSVTVERAAGLVAALAETVADLHEHLGIVHGRIDPSHVVIGPGGRPVLCGFAGGGRIGTTPPPGPTAAPGFVDPAASGAAALSPEVDVFGLGCLLRALVRDSGAELEPIPDRRLLFGRGHAPWLGYQRRALLTLADHATDEMPSRRPPARRLAADIFATVPSARLAENVDPFAILRSSAEEGDPKRSTRWVSLAAIGAGLVLVLFGLNGWRGDGSGAAANDARITSSSTAPIVPSTSPAHVQDDGVIVLGSQRFTAGVAGDRIAIGDWDCDGAQTPAVLRPSTGAVFVFEEWATASSDVSVPPTRVVTGATDIKARAGAEGCSILVVVRGDGTEEEITQ